MHEDSCNEDSWSSRNGRISIGRSKTLVGVSWVLITIKSEVASLSVPFATAVLNERKKSVNVSGRLRFLLCWRADAFLFLSAWSVPRNGSCRVGLSAHGVAGSPVV